MAKSKQQPQNLSPTILNRRARHDYQLIETVECGLALRGTEVKSIRLGRVSLAEGFAQAETHSGELYLYNVDISPYPQAGPEHQHEPRRPRKLLVHRRERERLKGHLSAKGITLVPTKMYFVRGRAKVEIAVAAGKRKQDKREDIKKKEADRDMRRAMARKRV